jgi:cobalamin biosynthesis protein CobD/CbiB
MSAMAGITGVRISKPGHYEIVGGRAPLTPSILDEGWRAVRAVGVLTLGLAVLAISGRHG